MKVFVAVLIFTVVSAFALPTLQELETEWYKFKVTYGKVYKSAIEEKNRKAIFAENYKLVEEHNQQFELGLESFSLKLNKFSDITADERKSLRGFKKSGKSFNFAKFQSNPLADLPDSFDWRPKGAVTEVKNQGSCGSCWAFSTTGSLEGQYFFKTGKLIEISEQNLVDCSDDNGGCAGGDMIPAFEYIRANNGIDSEESYPYTAEDGDCQYDVANNVTSVSGYVLLEEGNEQKLKEAVATIGPISVAIDASSTLFDHYKSGIYNPKHCKTENDDLDHAVLVVGYGSEKGKDYWLVKNSWGSDDWGIDGYIKMIRNDNNHCGIATEGVYPLMY